MSLACGLLCTGCATTSSNTQWGTSSSFRVGWDRTADAALRAAKNPSVWAPLAGAALLQIDNADHRLSNWAVDHTPVYGSNSNASRASDDLQVLAGVGLLASWLAIPGDDWSAKMHGGAVEFGAIAADSVVTETLKQTTGRERPNGGSNSFPSGHTSFAAVADTLTVRNLQSIPLEDGARDALEVSADLVTVATAWGRVEAGAHYPSDVLVGAALGNFFGHMFSDAFLGDELSKRLDVSFAPADRGGVLTWNWRF
jgi:hypothetical protein